MPTRLLTVRGPSRPARSEARVEEAHPVRQVPPARADQRRRHGRGLQGEGLRRRGLRAARRGQADPPEHRGGQGVHHACSSTRRRSRSSSTHANIAQIFDLGKVGDSLLHRDGVRPRPGPARDLRPLRASAASRCPSPHGLLRHHEGLRGPRLRAQQARPGRPRAATSSTATSARRTSSSPSRAR